MLNNDKIVKSAIENGIQASISGKKDTSVLSGLKAKAIHFLVLTAITASTLGIVGSSGILSNAEENVFKSEISQTVSHNCKLSDINSVSDTLERASSYYQKDGKVISLEAGNCVMGARVIGEKYIDKDSRSDGTYLFKGTRYRLTSVIETEKDNPNAVSNVQFILSEAKVHIGQNAIINETISQSEKFTDINDPSAQEILKLAEKYGLEVNLPEFNKQVSSENFGISDNSELASDWKRAYNKVLNESNHFSKRLMEFAASDVKEKTGGPVFIN